jgi:IMP dehydrogenase
MMFKFVSYQDALTYDDVALVPVKSGIKSRLDVDLRTRLGKTVLNNPIVSAPMDTVTSTDMAAAMSAFGGLGIIHRYMQLDTRFSELQTVSGITGVAVGIKDDPVRLRTLVSFHTPVKFVCLDVAHAHSVEALAFAERIVSALADTDVTVIAGNIATGDAARDFAKTGVHVVKVGIGSGSICSTRLVTGFGVPSITALMDVKEALVREHADVQIIADGGIRTSGDCAKALAAGADAVMLGSLLAGTDESPGEVVYPDGRAMKQYRGMASRDAQTGWSLKSGIAPEGIATMIPYKGSVKPILEDLAGGLRSAFSYANAKNLTEFYQNTRFVRVTGAGQVEASTHILHRR